MVREGRQGSAVAPVEHLVARKAEIDAVSSFPDELRDPLDERIEMSTWTWH